MADYTYLMDVPARRIHKSNASQVAEEASESVQRAKDAMLVLAASPGPTTEDERRTIVCEVEELHEALQEGSHTQFLAQYIEDHPDLCVDELCREDESKELWEDGGGGERRDATC